MAKLYNRAKMTTATTGTGTITLVAAVLGYQTFATSGVQNGDTVSYAIDDNSGAWEYGTGTYSTTGPTLTRTLGQSSTGSLLSLSGNSVVYIAPLAADIVSNGGNNTLGVANGGTGLTSLTAGYIPYASSSSAFSFSNLYSDGSNLGLGVTPSAWTTGKAVEVGNLGNAIWGAGASNCVLTSNVYYNSGTYKYANTGAASQYQQISGAHQWYSASSGSQNATITGFSSPTMTLDASGNLLVGTTTSGAKLTLYTSTASAPVISATSVALGAPLANYISTVAGDVSRSGINISKTDTTNTTSQIFMQFLVNNYGTGSGQINANGANACAFGTYSDRRLKQNIVDLSSQLNNILALRPREFDYIESEGGGHQIGFIAQEMQEIYPDAVGEREDGMLTIGAWSKTEARLVKAIQELAAKVQALEAKVA